MAADNIVTIEDIPVMYAAGRKGEPIGKQAPAAFVELESKLPSLKSRKFYGVVIGDEYRACVAIDRDADGSNLSHATWTIPGGKYARRKILKWEDKLHLLGQIFGELRQRSDFNPSRPCIEYYRSQKELFLMVPVQ